MTIDSYLPKGIFVREGKKRNTYYFRPSVKDENGKRKKINLGHCREQAIKKWLKIDLGLVSDRPSLNEVWENYRVKDLHKKSICTQKDYTRCWNNLVLVFDDSAIDDIEPVDVQRYLDMRDGIRGNREKALLSILFNYARRNGMTKLANPCSGTMKFKELPRDRYVEDDEFYTIKKHLPLHISNFLDLLYITGARVTDVLNIKLSDIDKKRGILNITISKNQNRAKYKTIPMIIEGKLHVVLNSIIEKKRIGKGKIESIFLNVDEKGQHVSYDSIRYFLDLARKATGIHFQLRDLRAKNASDSASVYEAKERLGHTTSTMTDNYRRSRKSSVVRPIK